MNELPYRQIHMDFHTSPLIPDIGAGFDAEGFARVLQKSRVNSINLFAKCHHGMYYYPTKIGTVHPNLKFDLLGAQMKACRDAGIRACVYTTAAWNEDWCDRHPEWQQVSPDGVWGLKKPLSADYYSWKTLCINNAEFAAYMKAELDEIYSLYKPDGFWIDIVRLYDCVCATCRAEMSGLGIYPGDHGQLARHNRMAEIKFMKDIYTHLKSLDAGLDVFFNGLPNEVDLADDEALSARNKRLYNTYVDLESLPSELWGYTHFSLQVNYLNKYPQELAMMNGKFHKAWGDFGSLRNAEALEYECFRALMNGAKICIGDQLHPSGKIDNSVYQRIGDVFGKIAEKEPWCYNTVKSSQIGVFTPNRALHAEDADASASAEGVFRIMSELHYLFDFIDFQDDIEKYELIILPDEIRLPDAMAEKLSRFIKKGGKLIATAKAGLGTGKDRFVPGELGVEYIAEAEFNPRYARIPPDRFKDIAPMDYVMYERGVTVKAAAGAEIWAYVADPYFNRSYEHFCSHCQTPPAGVTEKPCIVRNGNCLYIANPLFRDYAINGCKVYKDIIKNCMETLLERPLVKCDLPTTAELTLRKQDDKTILHILNYIIQRKCRTLDIIEEKWPLLNREIAVRTEAPPRKVYTAPQLEELAFRCEKGYTIFTIPEINGHQMVVLEQGKMR
ncbi:MAG: beta-galactosidase trimerization domain-containing protein [Treponema sp.]|jgi:hypothetical protein|nr:beta-galactosidase trimerization domain-containing protein [Treponema sp.]